MKRIALILGLAILACCGKAPAPAVIPTPMQERYGCGTLSGNPEPSIEIDGKYLSKYTVIDEYGKDADGKSKKYAYSLYLANKKIEKDWERAVMSKTNRYFKNLY